MSDKKFIHLPLYDDNGVELTQYLKVNADYFITGPARHRTEVVDFSEQVSEEMELIDRIIHGQDVKLVDVNSLYPEEYRLEVIRQERETLGYPTTDDEDPPTEPTWIRIPNFKDYEVNQQGIVRNFWTKRVLLADPNLEYEHVELHGKDGSPMMVTIKDIMKETFGE